MATATQSSGVRERPILFSAPMVKAILAGWKTQTRRIVKPQPQITSANDAGWRDAKSDLWRNSQQYARDCCPYGKPGDQLWVRETFTNSPDGVIYRATVAEHGISECDDFEKWRPSIFMPRWASRITLEITDVRVERVQKISCEDVLAEGSPIQIRKYSDGTLGCVAAKEWYRKLWDSINSAGSWESNPFVWCLSFRRIEAA